MTRIVTPSTATERKWRSILALSTVRRIFSTKEYSAVLDPPFTILTSCARPGQVPDVHMCSRVEVVHQLAVVAIGKGADVVRPLRATAQFMGAGGIPGGPAK